VVRCVARCCMLKHAANSTRSLRKSICIISKPTRSRTRRSSEQCFSASGGEWYSYVVHSTTCGRTICARCERARATISSRTAALRRPTCSGAGASTRNIEIGDQWAAVTVLQRAATGCAALQHTGIRCAPLHMLCTVAMRCAIPQTGFQTLRRAASRTCR
jgi:hypothetical protein